MTESVKDVAAVIAVITRVDVATGAPVAPVATALVRMAMAGARTPGFQSSEIIPPEELGRASWKLVQRFKSVEQAQVWQSSDVRRKILEQFPTQSDASNGGTPPISDEIAHYDSTFGNVATAIVTDVVPGKEDHYFAWEEKIQTAQANFPGYRGSFLQPPAQGTQGQWATLLRFDKPETLEKWFASPQRQELLKETKDFVKGTKFQSMSNSFPGWFPVDKETGEGPPNWKTSMLVLLGLFPVVMMEIKFLSPFETGMNSSLSSFLNLVLSVIATTWGTMPIFIKAFTWWLFPSKDDKAATDMKGAICMMLLFAAEIAAMWNLLKH